MSGDLISRSKLLADMESVCNRSQFGRETAKMCVKRAPAEDAEVVRHARWAPIRNDYGHLYEGECTNCGCEPLHNPFHSPWRYCPNCGAKMDAQEDA